MAILQECTSITDFINYGNDLKISHEKLFSKALTKVDDETVLIGNYFSLLNDYTDVIKKIIVEKEFDDDEYIRYMYKPKLYSYEEFGTPELWSVILKFNSMVSVTEFKQKKIKTFDKDDIFQILNEILILEKNNISINQSDIENELIEMNMNTL